jgi:hypothetical protein
VIRRSGCVQESRSTCSTDSQRDCLISLLQYFPRVENLQRHQPRVLSTRSGDWRRSLRHCRHGNTHRTKSNRASADQTEISSHSHARVCDLRHCAEKCRQRDGTISLATSGKSPDAVVTEKLGVVEHLLQDARQLGAVHRRQQYPPTHTNLGRIADLRHQVCV